MQHPDHYAALGVAPSADLRTIRGAYIAVMRRRHPDLHPKDPAAGDSARTANAAWHVLRDPGRRRAYDRLLAARAPDPLLYGAAGSTRPAQKGGHVAHSRDGERYRRAFHRAAVRAAAVAMSAGSLALLGVAAL
ncbi:MAG TPA: J domain-containing protein [Egibacteraceae bacterium]|nr:J domain-containing protein [Egibacteraceae bacterium]